VVPTLLFRSMHGRGALLAGAVLLLASVAAAQALAPHPPASGTPEPDGPPPALELPIRCTMGTDC